MVRLVPCLLIVCALTRGAVSQEPATAGKKYEIAKEPVYQQARQQFLLLLIGQQPARELWIVRDGDDFYIDRNANGDLTEAGEKVTPPKSKFRLYFVDFGMILDAHGQAHGPLKVHMPTSETGLGTVMFPIAKKYTQRVNFLPVRTNAETACVLHFDGPLTSGFLGSNQGRRGPSTDPQWLTLSRSSPRLLGAWVGTRVKDSPAVQCVTFSMTQEKDENLPRLKIVYENRDPQKAPIVETYVLEEETLTNFSRRVRAPMDAGTKAKFILTFPTLRDVPAYEIDVKVVD